MKTKQKFISIILLVTLLCGTLLLFCGCINHEEDVPWYKDVDNLEFVFVDERSEEKSFTYRKPYTERITFHYSYNENNTEEYIPKMKILHKGIEQTFYTNVETREWFYLKPDGFDFEDPQLAFIIKSPGAYRANLKFYLTKKPIDKGSFVDYEWIDFVAAQEVYIIIEGGEDYEKE